MSGDTLWDVAARNLGDPARWTEIYDANQAVIDATAREHPGSPVLGTSDHGHWVFPGTRLTIPGASCAPTTTPNTPTTEATPTSGGVSDEQACRAVGGIPATTQSGDFYYCGKFSTVSVLPHPFSPGELDQLQFADDTVGCLKDLVTLGLGVEGVLTRLGIKVLTKVIIGDKLVTSLRDASSGNQALIVWDAAEAAAAGAGGTGVACVKLFFNRAVAIAG
ncbi:LysM peptidoglycan-binding domain-containing protein [Streptomyces clavifer]|uniref:LysM peptidoglycan-binding domain-containing protein n=1 Tax=Streptomyces clavifer TaxID=68188 RepID=UPI0036A38F71